VNNKNKKNNKERIFMKRTLSTLTLSLLASGTLLAQTANTDQLAKASNTELLKELKTLKPLNSKVFKLNSVKDIGSMYMVNANMYFQNNTRQIDVFITKDKKIVLFGNAFNTETSQKYTTQKSAIKSKAQEKHDTAPLEELAIYKVGNGKQKYFVFTDPDCGFCRRFEDRYNEIKEDVTLYVLPYPLTRMHPFAKDKLLVFAEMSQAQKDEVMGKGGLASVKIPDGYKAKEDTVKKLDKTMRIAKDMGLTGTPYLVNKDGIKSSPTEIIKRGKK